MSLFPFAQGRIGGDWDPQAVKVAESLAGALGKHHAGAAYFLRLDLVRCDEGGWYVNEVEFFGNTALHLEVMDDAYEIFPQLVECIKDWMRL